MIAPLSDYGAISFAGISITDSAGQQARRPVTALERPRIIQLRASGGPVLAQPTATRQRRCSTVYWLRED